MSKKVLIVGGVAGGASCAARLRRLDESAEIIMFERGEYISFANCGLPYHIGGVIKKRQSLLLQTPKSFKDRFNVDVRIKNEVLSIHRDKKVVTVKNLETGETYHENYDVLVLSPGSTPFRPPIPGIDHPGVMTLWNLPDMDRILEIVNKESTGSAVVVGGGFIGLEMVENLKERGLDVTLVEATNQVMPPFDYDSAQTIHKHLSDHGVKLYLGDGVTSFDDVNGQVKITLKSGESIQADLAIICVGIRPNSDLARSCGLTVSDRGGIVTDTAMRTSDDSIYAVGDAVETIHYINKKSTLIPLAGPANKMGRLVADNICGLNKTYGGSLGSSIAKIFDITAACTGLNEKQLQREGMVRHKDYHVTIVHPLSHAGYYPGGLPLTLKVIFDSSGKVLGAQATGYDGVDKRIDVIASAMKFNATVYDLEELDLCYAPPYSSAKDPVNMAGYTGENILKGIVETITVEELVSAQPKPVIIDVRTSQERSMSFISGSINIPVDELRSRLHELDKNKSYVVHCAVGVRSYIAYRIMKQSGFNDVKNLAGGYTSYKNYVFDPANPGLQEKELGLKISIHQDKVPVGSNNGNQKVESKTIEVDACGLQCPGPVMKLYEAMQNATEGDTIKITSTDPGFFADAVSWCSRTKNTYIKGEKLRDSFAVWIKKGNSGEDYPAATINQGNDKTMILFSGDLDRAMAGFILANAAAAMGRKVTMFFTFWGLNILRKREKVSVPKSLIEKMFGFMMPRGASKLGLSNLNMMGMGSAMMKGIMKKKNVASLDELIDAAKANGVKLIACTMSMDVMGIHKEELIDGIDYAGAASYLGAAEVSDTNLFI